MSDLELEFDYDDDFDDFGESDYSLDSISETSSIKSEEVSYESWTLPAFIQAFFLDKVTRIKEGQLPQCSVGEILIMLQENKWDIDTVINKYFDDKHKLFKECGIVENHNDNFTNEENFTCSICTETYDKCLAFSLTCGHKYCLTCYHEYVMTSLHTGNVIRCMTLNCSLSIPHDLVGDLVNLRKNDSIVSGSKIPLNLNPLLIKNAKIYVESQNLNMKWCPVPDCNNMCQLLSGNGVITEGNLEISKTPMVLCPMGHQFCYACQYENHLPCPCWIVKRWIKKCEDDSETANWIQANTQICPVCNSSIEKSGGCNHMTCFSCRHEFCWICSKEWSIHGTSYYKCNKFDPEETSELEKSKKSKRLSLQRYLHFYRRFAVHENSMAADQKTLDKVNQRMKSYMQTMASKNDEKVLSWIDIQYLHDAVRSLTNGRKTLKWTYCFAFYLSNSNFSEIFEQNQEFLNKCVEDLSEIFEIINNKQNKDNIDILTQYKSKMINLSKLISMRQRTLIDSAEAELKQGLLKFET